MKLDENPSRPNGAWPGVRKTTSSATKVSRRARSPALTASIQIECTVRISRSSNAIACLRGLTRIMRQLVVYFCRHRGKCAGKGGRMASQGFGDESLNCQFHHGMNFPHSVVRHVFATAILL